MSPSCGRTQNLMVLVEPWCNRASIVILCEPSFLPENFYEEPQLIAIQTCLIMHWELPTVSSVCPCLVSWILAWHKFVHVWGCFHRFVTISVPWTHIFYTNSSGMIVIIVYITNSSSIDTQSAWL